MSNDLNTIITNSLQLLNEQKSAGSNSKKQEKIAARTNHINEISGLFDTLITQNLSSPNIS